MTDTPPTDLQPEDIIVKQEGGGYQAVLGFLPHNGRPKFYQAIGVTEDEAKKALVEILVAHLLRASATEQPQNVGSNEASHQGVSESAQ